MKVKLSEILKLDSFHDVKVVAGREGLFNAVENVYVMEVPDIVSYIDKEGLLFTTLFPIADDQYAMENFIPNLSNNKLSGVAIKLGRYVEKIPEFMIEQADRLSFPILTLPSSANFSLLSNDILTRLIGSKTKELEFRESISNKLHNLLLSGADIKDLVSYVALITNIDIIVISDQLKVIETTLEKDSELFEISEKQIIDFDIKNIINIDNKEPIIINDKINSKKDLNIQTIIAGNKVMGYLILIKNDAKRIPFLNVVIEQASILLAFLLRNRESLIQKERNYLDNFIRSILYTQYSSQTELIQKAKVFKWDIHFPNIILLIDVNHEDQNTKLNNYYKILDSEIITETISSICEIPIENCKTAVYNNKIICFVSIALINDITEKLNKASNLIMKHLKRFGNTSIGVSGRIYSMLEIPKAYEESILVHDIYKKVYKGIGFVEFYDSLGIFKLFHLINNREELESYVEEKLGVVIQSDRTSGMELIKTLQCLIENNMNMKKSADELFIHYNSLRYRVNKLKELGIEINDGNELTEVAIALRLISYLNYPL
ncbi:PucR family transcriptional regulator [Alkalibacterium iburiense]|uniref:PucR family transcriptional regulator n=1 Tax=Alkalibacterium iburiense TaxID=290589 RepID=A0ABN0XCK3_9LACT